MVIQAKRASEPCYNVAAPLSTAHGHKVTAHHQMVCYTWCTATCCNQNNPVRGKAMMGKDLAAGPGVCRAVLLALGGQAIPPNCLRVTLIRWGCLPAAGLLIRRCWRMARPPAAIREAAV